MNCEQEEGVKDLKVMGKGGVKVKYGEYLFTHHELIQKLGTIPRNKLSCKLDNVSAKRMYDEKEGRG